MVAVGEQKGLAVIIAAMLVVGTDLDRREDNANGQRIDRHGEQTRRPFEHDLGGLTAGVAEHGLVGVAHFCCGFERLHSAMVSRGEGRSKQNTQMYMCN